MQLGVMVEGQEGMTWDLWARLAETVERLGYESLWRSDHVRSLEEQGDRLQVEAWASFMHLAEATRRIRFGPLVSPMTFRHPALLAMQAAAVDALSGGRLDLGIGAGWNVPEHEAFGIPYPSDAVRQDMLEDGAQIIRALWSGQPATFQGKVYSLRDAVGSPRPVGARVIVGGGGEKRLMRTAARFADEWNSYGHTPQSFRAKNAVLDRHLAEVGRDPGQVRRSLMLTFAVGESDADVRRHLAAVRARHPGAAPAEAEQRPELMREKGWLVGQPEQVIAQIQELESAGVSRIMLQHLAMDHHQALELIAGAVLPRVADR